MAQGSLGETLYRIWKHLEAAQVYDVGRALDELRARGADVCGLSPLGEWGDLTPPAAVYFMEFRAQAAGAEPRCARGLLVAARDLDSDRAVVDCYRRRRRDVSAVLGRLAQAAASQGGALPAWWNYVRAEAAPLGDGALDLALACRPAGVRWWVTAAPFVEALNRDVLAPDVVWNYALDSGGRILSSAAEGALFLAAGTSRRMTARRIMAAADGLLAGVLSPCLTATGLLNASGARAVESRVESRAVGASGGALVVRRLELVGRDETGSEGEWPDVIGE